MIIQTFVSSLIWVPQEWAFLHISATNISQKCCNIKVGEATILAIILKPRAAASPCHVQDLCTFLSKLQRKKLSNKNSIILALEEGKGSSGFNLFCLASGHNNNNNNNDGRRCQWGWGDRRLTSKVNNLLIVIKFWARQLGPCRDLVLAAKFRVNLYQIFNVSECLTECPNFLLMLTRECNLASTMIN